MRVPMQLPPIPLKRSLTTPGPDKEVPSQSLRALSGALGLRRMVCILFL